MSSFPPNPVDGTIIEIRSGEFYIFNASTQSWTRIDGYKFGLATSNTPGLMSSDDLKKLNSLILPPPSSSLTGDNCDIVFKNGTVSLYSTDDSLSIKHDLSVNNPSLGSDETLPWQIHENTAGYDFRLNLNKLVEEIETRGRLSKIQLSGPDGAKGPIGEKGLDALDTGPKGQSGADGANSPFLGNLLSENLSIEQLEDNKNRAIVSIENENTDDGNYLVITRANIGDLDASPDRVVPKNFESPWVLILDKQEGKITRKIVSSNEDCFLSCKVSVSSIYYLNIDGIIDALKERYEYKLAELKANKELLIKSWLRVMSVIYNEQKYALCCALENCETRKRNTNDRRWIESQRIQAANGNMELNISTDKEDRVVSDKSKDCEVEQMDGNDSDRVTYGKECDDFLVKIKLDARLHNKDPRKTNSKFGYLTARLPAGDYYVEILDCCANFAAPQQNVPPPRPPALYSSQNVNGQNIGTGQFQAIGGSFSRSSGMRKPNASGVNAPASRFIKTGCNVTRTNRIGTKPGDSFGILKFGQAVNCNEDNASAICKEAKLAGVDISRPYARAGSGPFLNSTFSEQDYLVLGYVGADCRVVYDSKFTQIQTTNPQFNIRQNLAAKEVISLVGSYSGDLKSNPSGVVLKFINTQPWADANRISAVIGQETSLQQGGGFLNFGSVTAAERTMAASGDMNAIADGKVVTGGIRYEIKNQSWQNTQGNNEVGDTRAKAILGPAGYIPAAGERLADCATQDCEDNVSAVPNKGKWGGKIAILRKRPSLNFKLMENINAGTELTANQFEQYEDFSELVETEIYTSDFGYFDELNDAKNSYVGSNTLFTHAGGTIKVWIPNPDPNVSSADGGVIIGIKSRKCLEQITSINETEVTAAPIPAIYVYRNKISNDNIIGVIKPFILENENHSNNYKIEDDGNISLTVGPELTADTSKIFFVLANDGLGFYHVHNAKDGQLQTSIFSTYIIEKNEATTAQVVAGGPASLIPDQFADIYKASWSINNDSKGIVLSELSGDDWTITLDELNLGKVSQLLAYDDSDAKSVYILAQGNLSSQVEEAKDFTPCRSLFRSCNVPESLGGKYSLGIINRSRESFRICRILPEWKVPNLSENPDPPSGDNVWIRKPVTYAGDNEPCGASVCDVSYQVIAGTDGQIVPIPEINDLLVAPNPTSEGTSQFVDDLIDGRSLDFLLLINSTTTIKSKVDKLAKNLKSVINHFALRGVSDIRVAVARFGGATKSRYDIGSILTDQPFKRFRLGLLQTPRYLEDYDFESYGKGKYLPISGIQQNVGEQFYTVTGYVYDNTSSSPRPVNGALVHLRLPFFGNRIIQSSITDENGMYAFKINSKWPYEIRYDQSQNVIPNAEIELNLYNAPKMNDSWTFDQYSKSSSYRQYLQINGEWQTNQETQVPYTEDGSSIISLIPISQPDRDSAQQFVAAGMIFKDVKVESIGGENKLSFKVAIDDTGAEGVDFNDFESRIYQKISECPDQITSQLDPIISKTYKIAIGIKQSNSGFGYQYGDIQAGPIITIDQSDAEGIISKITCTSTSLALQTEEVPDFEMLQDFTYNVDSAVHALESIEYESDATTSRGFAAIKWVAENMPWFSNAVKMITVVSDVSPNTEKLTSIPEIDDQSTDITVPVTVDFVPMADVPKSAFPNNITNPSIISPHNWETNESSTSDLYLALKNSSTSENEDDLYIRTTELQSAAYGYITRLNTLTSLSNLHDINSSEFAYTTVKVSIRLRCVGAANDRVGLFIRTFNKLPLTVSELSSGAVSIISLIKEENQTSTQMQRTVNSDYFAAWQNERVDSPDPTIEGILTSQQSSLIVDADKINVVSTDPAETIDLYAGNWQTITAYLVVNKNELLNNPFYVQMAAIGSDSDGTSDSIDGRFEVSNLSISFEDQIFPTIKSNFVTTQDALDALNAKKIVLNGIVPIDSERVYEFAEIECSSHNYQYTECEYEPLTGEKIFIAEAWVIRQISRSSIRFVNGNKPVNERGGRKTGPDGRYCNGKSCGEFGITTESDGSSKLWVDHGARAIFGIKYYRISSGEAQVLQKPSVPVDLENSYGVPKNPQYPLRYSQSTQPRLSPFGTGLAYDTGGALFDIKDIDNSSNYYSIPEWQEPINDNQDGVFALENVLENITEDIFGSRKWKLDYDTRGISSETASYLVGKYKNQRIRSVIVVNNEYPNSQLPLVEDHTAFSINGTSASALDNSAPIRFGNSSDNIEYTRVITIKKGYKGTLEYQLTPDVYAPLTQYKAEPSIDLVQDPALSFPNNAKTTVYQPFWRFSIGLNASTTGLYTQNDLINVEILDQAKENGFHIIGGQLFDASVVNRTASSGIGGNGYGYVYGALVNLTIPSLSQNHVCSAITDIQGRFALKVPVEWISDKTEVSATISIPIYSQQTNDEWQIEPAILASQNSITTANRLYNTIGMRLPRNYHLTRSTTPAAEWKRIIQINDSRFTKESVNSYITDENIKSITIQSFFTDPRNYAQGLVLNENLLYSSSFIRIENVTFDSTASRFTFKIKSDDGGFSTTSKTNRQKGDLLFNGPFLVVSHPRISCADQNMNPYTTITKNINISISDDGTVAPDFDGSLDTIGGNLLNIGSIIIPQEEELSSETMKCGAFFQKFAMEKYREFLTRVPRIRPELNDCSNVIRGGRAARYIKVAGIPLTQEVYNGKVVSVTATMQSLPGSLIKAIIYDNQGRGMVLKGVEASFESTWQTMNWSVSDVETYINPLASTTDGIQALIDLGYSPSDPRLQDTQSRIILLTSELSIKLKDLFAMAFEWVNPDVGIVSFINDVKVAVQYANADGSTGIAYVDIANFEAYGKNVTDPGEIPLVTFSPQVVNGQPGTPGSYAETTFYLDANSDLGYENKIIDGTSIQIGQLYSKVYFKDAITPYSETYQDRLQLALSLGFGPNATPPTAVVKIGATDEETLKNLEKLINNSATNGIEYYDPYIQSTGFSQFSASLDGSSGNIQAYPAASRSLRIRSRTIGAQGNNYAAHVNDETTDPLTGNAAQVIDGAAFGQFLNGNWVSTNRLISVNNSIIQQGYMTAMNGGVDEISASDQSILQPTEEDESAYLENWWTITKANNYEQPCTRWKDYCPAAEISGDSCQRIQIENKMTTSTSLEIPLSKYIFTTRCPLDGCDMHHKQVEWYERGWRIGACCGALVEIDGIKWIVVKRSIGVDISCGGGESEENPCIKEAIESGQGHPAIAWPTVNGEEFIGRPTSGFARFVKDSDLTGRILGALSTGSAIEYRGNMTFADVNDKIPFILFPKA